MHRQSWRINWRSIVWSSDSKRNVEKEGESKKQDKSCWLQMKHHITRVRKQEDYFQQGVIAGCGRGGALNGPRTPPVVELGPLYGENVMLLEMKLTSG